MSTTYENREPHVRFRLKRLVVVGATTMFGATVMLGALGAPGAAARAQITGGFGAAPAHPDNGDPATRAYFKPVVAAGSSKTDQVLVTSTSDQPIHLLVSAVDGLTGQTSGAVYANRQDRVHRAGAWVKPATASVVLAPHGHQLVGFAVTVPAAATPGDHLAGIAFENANPTTSGGQFGVKEVVRTVVGIDIDVPGAAKPHIHLGALGLGALPGLRYATLTIHIGDDGRRLVKPFLNIAVRGPSGYRRTLVRRLDTILPGDTIAYPFVWPDDLAAGDYRVRVLATNGTEREMVTATLHLGAKLRGTRNGGTVVSASTVPFPVSPAAVAVLAIVCAAAALFVGFRFGARRATRDAT